MDRVLLGAHQCDDEGRGEHEGVEEVLRADQSQYWEARERGKGKEKN